MFDAGVGRNRVRLSTTNSTAVQPGQQDSHGGWAMNDRQRHALEAVRQFTRDVTVVLRLGRADRIEDVRFGTGTLICGASGRAHVLTARHNFPDPRGRNTNVGAADRRVDYQDAVAEVLYAPELPGRTGEKYVDVALLVLNAVPACELGPVGITADNLAHDSMVTTDTYSVLAGYPTAAMNASERRPGSYEIDVSLLHQETTGISRDELGRIRVGWRNTGEAAVMSHDFSHTAAPRPAVTDPRGISGGGFWKYDPSPGDGLWSPRLHGKLVGVAVAWNQRDTEFVEGIDSFGDWLRTTLATR